MRLACFAFLNSTVVDQYFRRFSGHTQVNATDLRTLAYPNRDTLQAMGREINTLNLSQEEIDQLVRKHLHIAWESKVWIAEDPDHMIHFNGDRFLGSYPDVSPDLRR
jgi:BsuBI/PstI restriction endonuclease domain